MPGLRKIDVRDDLLRKLGFESAAGASAGVLADVLAAMNYAQQTLWLAGPDYFSRTQIALTLVGDVAAYTLAETVQSVLGPVRIKSGRTLRAIESRAELDNFGLIYLGQASPVMASGTPLAYFVEELFQASAEQTRIKIYFAPAPTVAEAGAAVVEGVSDCTGFVTGDLASTDVLQVAQQYVESLFLPLARKALTRSTYFSASDLEKKIEADYQEALAMLRRAGGLPPDAKRADAREVAA